MWERMCVHYGRGSDGFEVMTGYSLLYLGWKMCACAAFVGF
jgi:hypothetical protein